MDQREVLAAARRAGVKLVRFGYCDVSGVARAKAVHVSQLASKLNEGVGLTRAQMSISLLEQVVHVDGMEPVGEIRLVPDPATFTVLPWSPGSAGVLCDQLDHGRRNWGACPRSYLKDMIARAAAAGITVQASFENEYYLARATEGGGFEPYDTPWHAPVYSSIGHDLADQVMIDTVDALEAQGMTVEQVINEYGPGQREIAIRYTDALGAADQQMKFRDTVRGVALQHGLYASFAPKPYPDAIGSGAHVHFSLWDTDGKANLLYDRDADRGLSLLGRQFIAGVAEHLPALVALTAPSFNSYRRLQPSAWASATTAWGFDNKEAALRVASPFYQREEQSYNIEFKSCDASANPYLALGGLIAAGLDGVARGLDPGAPAEHDPARLSAADLERSKIRPLPASMTSALDELEKDELLLGSLGDLLGRCYLAVRRSEAEAFAAGDTGFELRQHFYRF
jgi:glutamine synthetase